VLTAHETIPAAIRTMEHTLD